VSPKQIAKTRNTCFSDTHSCLVNVIYKYIYKEHLFLRHTFSTPNIRESKCVSSKQVTLVFVTHIFNSKCSKNQLFSRHKKIRITGFGDTHFQLQMFPKSTAFATQKNNHLLLRHTFSTLNVPKMNCFRDTTKNKCFMLLCYLCLRHTFSTPHVRKIKCFRDANNIQVFRVCVQLHLFLLLLVFATYILNSRFPIDQIIVHFRM